jgi:hypothetical protein
MTPITAAALVFAGLLSVLIFPVLSLSILRREPGPAEAHVTEVNRTPVMTG